MPTATPAPPVEEVASFRSVLKQRPVRILAFSRATSKLAQSTVAYGAMVYLASAGANQLQISLVAASTYLAALLFGLQGGTLADSLSKRVAIITGYVGLALLCLLVPLVVGTGVTQLVFIMFMSSALMQIVTPSLKSAVALVSTPSEMATVTSTVSVVGSIASAAGSSALAPTLIREVGIKPLLIVA